MFIVLINAHPDQNSWLDQIYGDRTLNVMKNGNYTNYGHWSMCSCTACYAGQGTVNCMNHENLMLMCFVHICFDLQLHGWI